MQDAKNKHRMSVQKTTAIATVLIPQVPDNVVQTKLKFSKTQLQQKKCDPLQQNPTQCCLQMYQMQFNAKWRVRAEHIVKWIG